MKLSLERALEYIDAGRIRGSHAQEPSPTQKELDETKRKRAAQHRASKVVAE